MLPQTSRRFPAAPSKGKTCVIKPNRIKAALREGRKAYGFRLTVPSPEIVEILGLLDYDFVLVDDEHGVFGNTDIENICRSADLVGTTPIARVPDVTQPTVNRRLDRGIRGIIGPHVASRAQAEELVQSCYFGPIGQRSLGGGRGVNYQLGIEDMQAFYREANDNMFVAAMIEDRAGMEDLEGIASVPGIDCIYIGNNDFAQGMGHPGDAKHPEVLAAIKDIADRVRRIGGRMREDCMVIGNLPDMLIDGGRKYARPRG